MRMEISSGCEHGIRNCQASYLHLTDDDNDYKVYAVVGLKERNENVWGEFLSLRRTLHTEKRDYAEWHRGRNEYAVWMICIQSQSVQSRFDAARLHLAEFLLEPYRRQAHVTLFVCGFPAEIKRLRDDYTVEESERCIRALKKAKPAPFEIKIGGINSFAAVPFLEVFDISGGIGRIRNVLSGTRYEIGNGEYMPHLTLGLYSGRFDTKMVAKKMSSFCHDSLITYFVDQISLTTYSARRIAGPLAVKHVIDLEQ